MPSAYAHDRFGSEVRKELPRDLRKMIDDHRNLFYIGLQGPDPFYYYNPLKENAMTALAEEIHAMTGSEFFTRVEPVSDEELIYLAGFLCHFALDASCHWYISQYMKAKGVTHEEIEGEFDRYLLVEDGLDPVKAVKTEHFHPENASAAVICHFFRRFYASSQKEDAMKNVLSVKNVEKSLQGFVRFEGILRCPGDMKRNTLYWVLKRVGKYDTLKGHITNKEENPACRESSTGLFTLYTEAIPDAVSLTKDFLRRDTTNFVQNPLLAYNFLGQTL